MSSDGRKVGLDAATDVADLRTEPLFNAVMEDHFCARCACLKSGWADVPNMVSDWCNDARCACHEEDQP